MEAKEWKVYKRLSSLIAALFLLAISGIGFSNGLSFGGENGELIGFGIWVSLTVIQLIGNDKESWKGDYLLFFGWMFSYLIGISAGAWAIYNWIDIPVEWLRWCVSIGFSGVAELLPERLIILFLRSLHDVESLGNNHKPNIPQQGFRPNQNKEQKKPWEVGMFKNPNQKPYQTPTKYTPSHRPNFGSEKKKNEPSYNNPKGGGLFSQFKDRDEFDLDDLQKRIRELEGED